MAVAEEGLQFPEPENEQERDKLSLDEAPEKPSTDEFESCRKRCGRDHASVLEECRRKYVELVKLELGLLQLRHRVRHVVDDKMSQSRQLAVRHLYQSQVQLLRCAVEDGCTALAEEEAQLSSLRSEIEAVSSALRPRTFCLLRRQHSVLQAHEWRRAAQDNLVSRKHKLHSIRASCVREASRYMYPMEVEAVTVDDEGDASLAPSLLVVDVSEDLEVDEDWVLSGQTKLPSPRIRINEAALPVNGNYLEYHATAQAGGGAQLSPAVRISAGLAHMAQFTWLLSRLLDTPLPHPMKLETLICNYGRADLSKRRFVKLVSQLDDNIMYLCMAQAVPSTALSQKGTISNLWCLVTHQEVGRSGAFVCYPELFAAHNILGTLSDSVFGNAPPTSFSVSPSGSHVGEGEGSGSGEESTDWEPVQHLSSLERHDAEMLSLKQEFFGDGSNVGFSLRPSTPSTQPVQTPSNTSQPSGSEGRFLQTVTSGLWSSMSRIWGHSS